MVSVYIMCRMMGLDVHLQLPVRPRHLARDDCRVVGPLLGADCKIDTMCQVLAGVELWGAVVADVLGVNVLPFLGDPAVHLSAQLPSAMHILTDTPSLIPSHHPYTKPTRAGLIQRSRSRAWITRIASR